MTDEEYRRQEAAKARAHKEKMDAHHEEVRNREAQRAAEKRKADQQFADRMSGQPTCFAAGTAIMTPTGMRRIETLVVDDEVSAFCGATGSLVKRQIRKQVAHTAAPIWEISILDGEQPLGTTGCHLFLTKRGWKRTRQLRPGECVRTNQGWARIQSISRTTRIEPVYNLIVDDLLTYVANGVVAHSFAYLRLPRTWLHRLHRSLQLLKPSKVCTTQSRVPTSAALIS